MSTLDDDGKKRLQRVLELAKGKMENIPYAIRDVMNGKGGMPGVSSKDRRVYLFSQLRKRAGSIIRDIERKQSKSAVVKGPETLEEMFGTEKADLMRREAFGLNKSTPESTY